jgi:hypothetical protein
LKEYRKKKRRDTGLDYLKYRSVFKNGSDNEESSLIPITALEGEYQLPTLPKAPTLYNEYILRLNVLDKEITNTLNSSPRKEYTVTIEVSKIYLSLGSLYK